jgi:mannose-6-phosphate isomerase-like protein (cupin superfamily)
MLVVDLNLVQSVIGSEETKIRQIFHPHNTMLGIRYSIVHCLVEPGKSSKPHKLKSSEVYVITNGEGVLHVDNESCQVKKDHAAYVPPHSRQFIENTGKAPLEFLCIVDPAWKQEDEMVD